MTILINLNDARKKLNELEGSVEYNKGVTDAYNALFDLPTIEAEPKHGRWVSTTSTLTGYWHKCSVCGGLAIPYYNGQDILSPYCPWCGARMDEVEE